MVNDKEQVLRSIAKSIFIFPIDPTVTVAVLGKEPQNVIKGSLVEPH